MTPSELPDPARLAAFARSILACPSSVELAVDGVPDAVNGREFLGAEDPAGEPMFSCLVDSPLARAGAAHRSALLTLGSALGPVGSSDRDASLTLAGRLETRDSQDCPCCEEVRDVVALDLDFVLLARPEPLAHGGPARDRQLRVPLEHFRSPTHCLNRGFLQRSTEHANDSHQDDLRRAISAITDTRLAGVVGVTLRNLLPHRVDVEWVDTTGSHRSVLTFPFRARAQAELGEMLRQSLHAQLC